MYNHCYPIIIWKIFQSIMKYLKITGYNRSVSIFSPILRLRQGNWLIDQVAKTWPGRWGTVANQPTSSNTHTHSQTHSKPQGGSTNWTVGGDRCWALVISRCYLAHKFVLQWFLRLLHFYLFFFFLFFSLFVCPAAVVCGLICLNTQHRNFPHWIIEAGDSAIYDRELDWSQVWGLWSKEQEEEEVCSSFGAATKSIGCWQFICPVGYGYVKICVICEIMSLLWFLHTVHLFIILI